MNKLKTPFGFTALLCMFCLQAVLLVLVYPVGFCHAETPNNSVAMASLLQKGLAELVELEVSLATGTPKPLKLAPSVATVITAQDIEDMGAATLDEALQTVPGLHVTPSNFNRLNSSYSIRGILTKMNQQVLVLIDGQPVRYFSQGVRPDAFKMSIANIARIEVVRGPGSALYGADAFAGTINVITKNSADIDGTKTSVRYGSFDTQEAVLQHGNTYDGWDVALNLDYMKSAGDKSRIIDSDLQTVLDSSMITSASLAPGSLRTQFNILDTQMKIAKDNWSFRIWNWHQKDAGEGAGVAQALDPDGTQNENFLTTDLTYNNKHVATDLDATVRVSYTDNKVDAYLVLFPAGAVLPIGSDGNISFATPAGVTAFPDGVIGAPSVREKTTGIDHSLVYSGWSQQVLRIGVGYAQSTLDPSEKKNFGPGVLDGTQAVQNGMLTDVTNTPNIYVKDLRQYKWYGLLQDEWTLAKAWVLTAGVRYDHYSDVGGTTNPRVALVWEATSELTAKLLYGRAFRPPAPMELYYVNNPASLGNLKVKPETIDTYELAFNYQPRPALRIGFNIFTYDIEGLIEFVPDAGQSTSTARNAKSQKGQGFELEADWLATDTIRLRGNMAYQRSENKKTHEVVPDAPGLRFYANAHWKFMPQWSLDGQYWRVMDRHRAVGDTRPAIEDYSLANLTLRRKNIANHWDMALAVRNLFNNNVREPSQPAIPGDFPMESRGYWAELKYVF
ncbi:MAG: TonB-dependent receptor [Nitrospirae bacterium]|nr:TonB-dependent receptor [Nitrospirota bacterium]